MPSRCGLETNFSSFASQSARTDQESNKGSESLCPGRGCGEKGLDGIVFRVSPSCFGMRVSGLRRPRLMSS